MIVSPPRSALLMTCIVLFAAGVVGATPRYYTALSLGLEFLSVDAPHIQGELGPTLRLEGSVDAQVAPFVFRSDAGVRRYPDGSVEALLPRWVLGYRSSDRLEISVGRFSYPIGRARELPVLAFFGTRSDWALPLPRPGDRRNQSHKAAVTAWVGPVEAAVVGSWEAPDPLLPEIGSPWFPAAGYPDRLTFPNPSHIPDYIVLERAGFRYLEYHRSRSRLSDISCAAVVTASRGPVGLTGLYYYGWDARPVLAATIEPESFSDPFFVEIEPLLSRVHAVGASAGLRLCSFAVWVDAVHLWNRRYLTSRLGGDVLRTDTVLGRGIDVTSGVSVELAPLNTEVVCEYTREFPLGGTDVELEALEHSVLLKGAVSLLDTHLVVSPYLMCAFDEGGASFGGELRLLLEAVEVEVYVPWFGGAAESLLGQFGDVRHATLTVRLR